MAEVRLILPMPPSVNALLTNSKHGGRRKSPVYAAWLTEAGWRINAAKAAGELQTLAPKKWYWTDVRLPRNHLGDSDNRLKALHDILCDYGITPDDKWLLGGTYMRCDRVAPSTCEVAARTVSGASMNEWDEIKLLAERMIS